MNRWKKPDLLIFFIIAAMSCAVLATTTVDIKESARLDYLDAMKYIGAGNTEMALLSYEKALDSDQKVIIWDDKGLISGLISKYFEASRNKPNAHVFFKLGELLKITGKYEDALAMFMKVVKDYPAETEFVEKSTQRIAELNFVIDSLKKNAVKDAQDAQKAEKAIASSTRDAGEKEIPSETQKQEKDDSGNSEIEGQISKKEQEIAAIRKDYDLWFSLTYGPGNANKKDYNEAMVYFYEKKLKQAEAELQNLKDKLP